MSDALSHQSLQHARSLYRAGRLAEAAGLYRDYLNSHPGHFEALETLGLISFKSGQFDQAQDLFGEAVRSDPRNASCHHLRGTALLQLKRHEEAIACFDRALSIKPDFIDARHSRRHALDRLRGTNARYGHIVHDNGLRLLRERRFEKALLAFDEALEIQNGLLMRDGPFEDAQTPAGDVLKGPGFVDAMSNRATALASLRRLDEALVGFSAALLLDPAHAASWNGRAHVLAAMNRFDEAVAHYDRALSLRPDFPEARTGRANALAGLKSEH